MGVDDKRFLFLEDAVGIDEQFAPHPSTHPIQPPNPVRQRTQSARERTGVAKRSLDPSSTTIQFPSQTLFKPTQGNQPLRALVAVSQPGVSRVGPPTDNPMPLLHRTTGWTRSCRPPTRFRGHGSGETAAQRRHPRILGQQSLPTPRAGSHSPNRMEFVTPTQRTGPGIRVLATVANRQRLPVDDQLPLSRSILTKTSGKSVEEHPEDNLLGSSAHRRLRGYLGRTQCGGGPVLHVTGPVHGSVMDGCPQQYGSDHPGVEVGVLLLGSVCHLLEFVINSRPEFAFHDAPHSSASNCKVSQTLTRSCAETFDRCNPLNGLGRGGKIQS